MDTEIVSTQGLLVLMKVKSLNSGSKDKKKRVKCQAVAHGCHICCIGGSLTWARNFNLWATLTAPQSSFVTGFVFVKLQEAVSLRLSSRQIALLLSSIWAQSTSPANMPENYEAIAHTYSLVLLFSRAKVNFIAVLLWLYRDFDLHRRGSVFIFTVVNAFV